MVLCHKATETLLVWNDAFGFMPVFSYQPPSGETSHAIQAVSSYWDCLVPRNMPAAAGEQGRGHDQSLLLEWNEAVLAEYILFGTSIRNETFLQGLTNLEPGSCMLLERVKESIHEQDERVILVKTRTQQYVQSYGACEELIKDEESSIPPATMTPNQRNARSTVETNDNQRSAPDTHSHINQLQKRNGKWYSHGVEVLNQETQQSLYERTHHPPLTKPAEELLLRAKSYIHQALVDIHQNAVLLGSALTGGGDTRLLLACLPDEWRNDLRFQTHNLQPTDASIARVLAKEFRLIEHKSFRPITTDQVLRKAIIHDQIPLRRRSEWPCLPVSKRFRQIQSTPTHVLHGRFGTEFLGFLCFDKSSLVGPPEDIDSTLLEKDGNFIFAKQDWPHPLERLKALWRTLEEQRIHLLTEYGIAFDVGYALQLQLFTRAFCCDIYGGLRKGSWFALPYAFFLRNECSPFLDARLLRLLTCRVTAEQKSNPYEWYGDLYQVGVSNSYRSIPCNNKMLSIHSQMPCAIKKSQPKLSEYVPETLSMMNTTDRENPANGRKKQLRNYLLTKLRKQFSIEFWDCAMSIIRDSKSRPIEEMAASDERIRSMVKTLGPVNARLYSIRLGSVLLWLESRFS